MNKRYHVTLRTREGRTTTTFVYAISRRDAMVVAQGRNPGTRATSAVYVGERLEDVVRMGE